MVKSVLTDNQKLFLDFFSNEPNLHKDFYFSGGTALSEYYLQHRYSEDLDFFSEKETPITYISPFIKKSQKILKFESFDFQNSFNRNIFHLIFDDNNSLKVEFTYFPFPQIEEPKIIKNIKIDSLVDIATNKVFTISQNPRGRDFFDLYYIFEKNPEFKIEDLIKKAKVKFDWHVDPIQLGSQMLKVNELLDDPILTKDIDKKKIISFVHDLARELNV